MNPEARRLHLYGSIRASFGASTSGDGRRAAQPALPLGRLAAQDVLLERLAAQELSALGPLEALGGAAVCLQLRHRSSFFARATCFAPAWLPSRGRLRGAAASALPPPPCGLRLRIVCIWLPSSRGIDSAIATSRQFLDQPLENPAADFRVRHLAAAEEDRRLHLVAVLEEALDVLLLELVIVLVHLRTELDLLDLDDLLVLPRLARALLLLVLVLPEVHDAADRRHGRRRDLDQVEPLLLGDGQGLRRRHDAELLRRCRR